MNTDDLRQRKVSRHKLTEARVFMLHQRIIEEIKKHPERVINIAKKNLSRWKDRNGNWQSYQDWEEILLRSPDDIISLLESGTDEAALIRSNSPFAGVISARDRWNIIKEITPAN